MHPREPGVLLQKWAQTQVAVGARVACYHDEIKVSLPAIWTPLHHLLFTFYHVDLQTKLEAPKPVSPVVFFPFVCSRVSYSSTHVVKRFKAIVFILAGGNWLCSASVVHACPVCF